MTDRPRGLFYEDLEEGTAYSTKSRTVTEADIVNFAGISGDFNELHLNEEHARKTAFGKRIAHGMLGLAICSGLVQQLDLYNDTLVAFLGLNWSFKKPIFIGDTVHAEQTVKSKRTSKNPERHCGTGDHAHKPGRRSGPGRRAHCNDKDTCRNSILKRTDNTQESSGGLS